MNNLKLAVRRLLRTPFVTSVAVLSLALGIGANAAIYSLFDEMLLQALPVEEPDRLVNLSAPGPKPGSQSCSTAGGCDEVFSYRMFRDIEAAGGPFAGVAAHRSTGANLALRDRTESGEAMLVSGSYFGVLGVRPALGRLLGPADDERVGEHFVAVLSHDYWVSDLGADPGVLNETLVVNGHPMTIVGVAGAGFRGTTLGSRPDVFLPITMRGVVNAGFDGFDNRRSYWAYLFARLRPGVPIERAEEEVNAIYRPILAEVEAPLQTGMSDETLERFLGKGILVEPGQRGQSSLHEEARTPLLILLVVTGMVLLTACANIANLLLARGAGRAQEMAVRTSLGAGRGRLLSLLLIEAVMLALLGGLASLVVAHWTLAGIAALLPADAVRTLDLRIGGSVVAFTAAVAVGTGLVFGLYPALHTTRPDLVTALKANSGQPSGGRAAARFRSVLVTTQIALSMALLIGAGLFLRSMVNITRIDLGLRQDNLVTFQIAPELNGYEQAESTDLFERVEEGLAALPGVSSVSAAIVPVLAGNSWGTDVRVQGFESGPDIDSNSRRNMVGVGYFSTLGVPLLTGREFTRADGMGAPRVAVVNEAFTRKFGLDARRSVGARMSEGGEDLDIEIVGIVQDAKYNDVKGEVPPLFFTPYRQRERVGNLTFYARATGDPQTVLEAVPGLVRRLDPDLPVEELKTLEQQIRDNIVVDRVISTLSSAFGILATVLAAVGLYGVLAYTVAERTREIGLRMALGAERGGIRRMVLRQVARMTLVGAVIGIAVALAAGRGAQSVLFEMEPNDPLVVVLGVAVLGAVALAAGYVPALRASRVDPMEALRYE